MKFIGLLCLLCSLLAISRASPVGKKIDLSGEWRFAVDTQDKGIPEKWFNKLLNDKVVLPGSMSTNGKGDDISLKTRWTGQIVDSSFFKSPTYARYRVAGNIKIPFWLQSLKHYQGAAWYQKEVTIPASWKGEEITLFLERCHWESRLWIDEKEIGMRNSLGTPHLYDLSLALTPGKHILTICMDNRTKEIDPGLNSHSISDHTQTNWNGIAGKMYLEARSAINIHNLQIYPDIQLKKITAKINVSNFTGKPAKIRLNLAVNGAGNPPVQTAEYKVLTCENLLSLDYSMGDSVRLWSEFHPALYNMTVVLTDLTSFKSDTCRSTFGMREFIAAGKQIQVNHQPIFLRGTLECAIFPKTGYPPTKPEEWLRIFRICRAHGLNHMRFHSWCPPEAAFEAADQAGFYLHVECSSWANTSSAIGDGRPIDKYLYDESQRMVETYGNHPSFCMMGYGTEPGGGNQVPYLTEFVNFWKKKDNRRIYTSGAGWPALEVNDFMCIAEARIQRYGEGLKSIINASPPNSDYDWSSRIANLKQTVVGNEIGEWCVYPDFKEISKYTGVVRAKNFEIFQETLKEHGMEHLADSFLMASGKLQALCYKAEIEAAFRTPVFGGFQLLDLHDFPGQGTALVGVLNAFWEEKGYISPKEYSHFCNLTVPLARMKKFIFTNDENFEAGIEVAHYGESPIVGCKTAWKIYDTSGKIIQRGELAPVDVVVGGLTQLGRLLLPLKSLVSPEKLTLEVTTGNSFTNSWDFWVYPVQKEKIPGVEKIKIVSVLDQETTNFLEQGGTVLLTFKKGSLKPEFGGKIAVGFSSIFWNMAWTQKQAPHTLGILCDPGHPALAGFPTEYHSNWQWWDAMSHSVAIDLTSFDKSLNPIVRVIDDWFTNRPLALLFEARVGKGKVVVSGIDLQSNMTTRPEARQLLYSLEKYMTGNKFNPKVKLDANSINNLIKL
ncbi:MAG: sugar-binding domain-containing protein [Mariniphaga sp.]